MNFKNAMFLRKIMIAISCLLMSSTQADELVIEPVLKAKPASCVSLHKGQLCYQKILFTWQSSGDVEYCLHNDELELLIYCSAEKSSRFVYEYASKSSVVFSLRARNNNQSISATTVRNAWVYRTGRRSSSGWRLF